MKKTIAGVRHTFSRLGGTRDLVNYVAVDVINPRPRSFSFGAHGQLGLVAEKNVTPFVHHHVRSQRQAAQSTVFQLLDSTGIFHVGCNAKAAVVSSPTRQTRADPGVRIMLVEKWATSNVGGRYLGAVEVCRIPTAAVARWRWVGDTTDLDRTLCHDCFFLFKIRESSCYAEF
jgi:hypothetical protein